MSQNLDVGVVALQPGQKMEVEVAGLEVLLANVDGKFYAINNVCTHRQCPLTAGSLSGKVITCACHASKFDITTGDVLSGPATRAEPSYRVTVEDGIIAVDVERRSRKGHTRRR
ncbi:MAG: Rieske (2Fe-2S) protein [Actinobacteria bacterium]|nr:Rieske (2Fe-2S) protein [Actinomycetota bacterium]